MMRYLDHPKFPLIALVVLLLIYGLIGCGPVVKSPPITEHAVEQEIQRGRLIVVEQLLKEEAQLQRVAYRVLEASRHLCEGKLRGLLGFTVANRHSYGSNYIQAMEKLWFTDDVTVATIVLDSPATRAGLRAGDIVISVNDLPMNSGENASTQARKILYDAAFNTQKVRVYVRRGEMLHEFTFEPAQACDFPVTLTNQGIINAMTDGAAIRVDSGMMRFTQSDDELAVVLGHEVAHNIMGHIPKKWANFAVGSVVDLALFLTTGFQSSAFGQMSAQLLNSQGFELEADYVGLYLTTLAGYDIDDAPQLWRRMGIFHPQFMTPKSWSTHPSTPERYAQLEATVAEIQQKRRNGTRLDPEGYEKRMWPRGP